MRVMEPSSSITFRFSWKSQWQVTKVRNNSYAETYGTRFEDHTYQLLRSYSRALLRVLTCYSLATRVNLSSTCEQYCTFSIIIHMPLCIGLPDVFMSDSPTGCPMSLTGGGEPSAFVATPPDSSPDVLCSLAVHGADW